MDPYEADDAEPHRFCGQLRGAKIDADGRAPADEAAMRLLHLVRNRLGDMAQMRLHGTPKEARGGSSSQKPILAVNSVDPASDVAARDARPNTAAENEKSKQCTPTTPMVQSGIVAEGAAARSGYAARLRPARSVGATLRMVAGAARLAAKSGS